MKSILVVGIGNFGAWWVLSLTKIRSPLNIYCFDPDPEKYEVLRKRLDNDQAWALVQHKVQFLNSLIDAQSKFDVIVVSTNADIRLAVVQDLKKLFHTKKWIIEKVIAQSPDQLMALTDCLDAQDVYVNHSRRLQPSSTFCKAILRRKSLPMRVRYAGGCWELASNSFHFVDLVSYWFETELVRIDADGLYSHWHPSSTRNGFFDVRGMLKAHFSNGVQLDLDWGYGNDDAAWTFEYLDGEVKYNEITGEISENGAVLAIIPLLNFSEMGFLLEPVLIGSGEQGNNLPSLTDVSTGAFHLLNALLAHWKSCTDNNNQTAPIS